VRVEERDRAEEDAGESRVFFRTAYVFDTLSRESPDPAARSPTRADAAPALSALGLRKRFGDRVAFEDDSFAIGHGEVFGFRRLSD
jgi:hypothetical protein